MSLWTWEEGRQSGGYRKLTLAASKWLKFDCHLIVLPEGSEVPEHTDPAPGGYVHHRINITLTFAKRGGITWIRSLGDWDWPLPMTDRIYRFKPSINPHGVMKVESGALRLLSIGWLRKHDN